MISPLDSLTFAARLVAIKTGIKPVCLKLSNQSLHNCLCLSIIPDKWQREFETICETLKAIIIVLWILD